jgi:uncharacterized membrane protein
LEHRIALRPNCSLSPKGAALFYISICLASLTLALVFVLQGLWPILPFWGLEMLVLGLALMASMRRRHYSQTILIQDARITVTTRDGRGERKREFSRHWAKVKLRRPRTNLYPSVLVIESHGRELEIGGALTDEERASLAARLQRLVGGMNESPPLGDEAGRAN